MRPPLTLSPARSASSSSASLVGDEAEAGPRLPVDDEVAGVVGHLDQGSPGVAAPGLAEIRSTRPVAAATRRKDSASCREIAEFLAALAVQLGVDLGRPRVLGEGGEDRGGRFAGPDWPGLQAGDDAKAWALPS